MMTLAPGDTSDETPSNEHPQSEQWLFVVSGTGTASVGKRRSTIRNVRLREHSLLVIEKGELHQIRNTGRRALITLNIYVPPAYKPDGNPR
jgi:mannose-6-phosphate isomerase-like protein (cupin superfamily)